MYEENDYMMRMIHEMVRTLVKLILKIDTREQEEIKLEYEIEEQYRRLKLLVDDGKINEAENLLVDGLDTENLLDFKLALLFYEYINQKDDEFLEENDYSRQEVRDGLKYAVSLYGYGSMMDAFFEE